VEQTEQPQREKREQTIQPMRKQMPLKYMNSSHVQEAAYEHKYAAI
jgi:hypothetical protein